MSGTTVESAHKALKDKEDKHQAQQHNFLTQLAMDLRFGNQSSSSPGSLQGPSQSDAKSPSYAQKLSQVVDKIKQDKTKDDEDDKQQEDGADTQNLKQSEDGSEESDYSLASSYDEEIADQYGAGDEYHINLRNMKKEQKRKQLEETREQWQRKMEAVPDRVTSPLKRLNPNRKESSSLTANMVTEKLENFQPLTNFSDLKQKSADIMATKGQK